VLKENHDDVTPRSRAASVSANRPRMMSNALL
jgi:hypothetical protein